MDLSTLSTLTEATGPFVSVYSTDPHTTADAQTRRELKGRSARTELAEAGAPAALADEICAVLADPVTTDPHAGRVLIAGRDGILIDRPLPLRPEISVARYSPRPYLAPLARLTAVHPHRITVLVDAAGADVTVTGPIDETVEETTVTGEVDRIHKVDSSYNREYHDVPASAEEGRRHNHRQIADAVSEVAARRPEAPILLGGEDRSITAVTDELEPAVAARVHATDAGARDTGAHSAELREVRFGLLEDELAARTEETAERFAQAEAGDLAVHGLHSVTAALRTGNVETLLIGAPTDARIWLGPDGMIGAARAEVTTDPEAPATDCRADEAVPYAALAVGADLVAMDDRVTLHEGFGAILRYPMQPDTAG